METEETQKKVWTRICHFGDFSERNKSDRSITVISVQVYLSVCVCVLVNVCGSVCVYVCVCVRVRVYLCFVGLCMHVYVCVLISVSFFSPTICFSFSDLLVTILHYIYTFNLQFFCLCLSLSQSLSPLLSFSSEHFPFCSFRFTIFSLLTLSPPFYFIFLDQFAFIWHLFNNNNNYYYSNNNGLCGGDFFQPLRRSRFKWETETALHSNGRHKAEKRKNAEM